MKKLNVSLIILSLLAMVGCASAPPPQVVDPIPPKNEETLQALSQLVQLKEEMKQLRNKLEENQFNSENIIRQQRAQIDDLDQRISSLESGQVPGSNSASQNAISIPSVSSSTPTLNDVNTGASTVTVVETPGVSTSTSEPSANSTTTSNSTPNVTIPSEEQTVSLSEQESYDKAFDLLKRSRYEDAILEFQTLANTWPDGGLADDAYYWISEAYYVNREFEDALTGFRTVVNRYPDSQRVPEAMLKVGYIQYDIGSYNEAADTFRNILAQFPGHQVAVSAQTRLQRIEQTIQ